MEDLVWMFTGLFLLAVLGKFLALLGAAACDWTTPNGTHCRMALVLMSASALLFTLAVLGARALEPFQWFHHVLSGLAVVILGGPLIFFGLAALRAISRWGGKRVLKIWNR